MSVPSRPGTPRTSSTSSRSDARSRTTTPPSSGRSSATRSSGGKPAAPRAARKGPTTGPIAKPSSRPGGPTASARTSRDTGPRIDPSRPKGSWTGMLTWRTAVMVGVLALAFAVVAPSVRAYMDQQAMLASLRAEAETARTEVDDLEADVARWDDPAFLVAQARERLAYVFPGETPYRVIDPESVTGPADGSPAAERSPDALEDATWYDRLWGSVVEAGEGDDAVAPAQEPVPAPVESGEESGEEPAGESGGDGAGGTSDEAEQLTDVDFGG